jgi:RHS repeat-associated protein
MRRVSTLTYLHGDHLGSASMTTTAGGSADDQMRYYPYGDTRYGSMATDRRFTGQREETAIGLYDYAHHTTMGPARYYDPVIGRFIQADTGNQKTIAPSRSRGTRRRSTGMRMCTGIRSGIRIPQDIMLVVTIMILVV